MMFWLQSGLSLIALLLIYWFLPETIPVKKSAQLAGLPYTRHMIQVLSWIKPIPILKLQRYPNLILTVGIHQNRTNQGLPPISLLFALTKPLELRRRCCQLEYVYPSHKHSTCP